VFFTRDAYGQNRRHSYGGLWNGLVAVGMGDPGGFEPYVEPENDDLVDFEKKVRRKLELAGRGAFQLLELVYGQPLRTTPEDVREDLRICYRAPFGLSGGSLPGRVKMQSGKTLFARRHAPLRGAAALAHLTPAAERAYAHARRSGTLLSIEEWTDRLGARLQGKAATSTEKLLGDAIAREAKSLLAWAHGCYLRPYARVARPGPSRLAVNVEGGDARLAA